MIKTYTCLAVLVLTSSGQVHAQSVYAQSDAFKAGKTIVNYGKTATVPGMVALPKEATFKVSFDVAKMAKAGEINRSIESVARFINMHTAHGVAVKDINLAVVIHGSAVKDFTNQSFFPTGLNDAETTVSNKNADLIDVLQQNGVKFYVCGQSATYHGIKTEDLLPGVNMSLSAMTAHALLQQQGYTINPF